MLEAFIRRQAPRCETAPQGAPETSPQGAPETAPQGAPETSPQPPGDPAVADGSSEPARVSQQSSSELEKGSQVEVQ